MEEISSRLAAFLTRFNTHRNFWIGLFLSFASVGLIGGRDGIDLWVTAHLRGFAAIGRAYVDGSAEVALVIVWPAIISAALGLPAQLPSRYKKPPG